eukprot:384730-Pleurochrysis_carterae.AAC.1
MERGRQVNRSTQKMTDVLPVTVKLTDKSVHKTDLSRAHATQKLKLSSACVKELKLYCNACHPLQ